MGRRYASAFSTLLARSHSCLRVLLHPKSCKLPQNKVGKYSWAAAITAGGSTHQRVTDEGDIVVCHSVYACARRTEL